MEIDLEEEIIYELETLERQAEKAREESKKAKEKLNTALQNLIKNGFSEKEAKEILGL